MKITNLILILLIALPMVMATPSLGVYRFLDSDGDGLIGPVESGAFDNCFKSRPVTIKGGYSCIDIFDSDGDGSIGPGDDIISSIIKGRDFSNPLLGCPNTINIDSPVTMKVSEVKDISASVFSFKNVKRGAIGIEFSVDSSSTTTANLYGKNVNTDVLESSTHVYNNTNSAEGKTSVQVSASSIPGTLNLNLFIKGDVNKHCADVLSSLTIQVCEDADGDGYNSTANCGIIDCDDTNSAINPNALEVAYDGIDNDCNALTLDNDLDQDGFVLANDCDDGNANINPNALEICDGKDNNCKDGIDEGVLTIFYQDLDLDGEGNNLVNITSCLAPLSYVTDNKDCNDGDVLINTAALEVNDNSIDENCDGTLGYTQNGGGSSGGSGGGSGGSHRRPAVVTNNPIAPIVSTYEPIQDNQNDQGTNTQGNEITGQVVQETGNGNLYVVLVIVGILGILGLFIWKKYY